jgi:hypothetical protein
MASLKQTFQSKTTWTGIAGIGFALFSSFASGAPFDPAALINSIVVNIGLIMAADQVSAGVAAKV